MKVFLIYFMLVALCSCLRNSGSIQTNKEYMYATDNVQIAFIFFSDSTFYYQLKFDEPHNSNRSSFGKWNHLGGTKILVQTSKDQLKFRVFPTYLEILDSVVLDFVSKDSFKLKNMSTGLNEVYRTTTLSIIDTSRIKSELLQ